MGSVGSVYCLSRSHNIIGERQEGRRTKREEEENGG
jgi:hypothetical protein